MDFTTAIKTCLRKYADFQGRAPRSEFWYFRLFYALVVIGGFLLMGIVAGAAGSDSGGGASSLVAIVVILFMFAMFLPDLAVTVRRLHDRDMSGWWFLIAFVPFGGIVLLVWFCMKGTDGENRFGSDPFGVPSAASVFT